MFYLSKKHSSTYQGMLCNIDEHLHAYFNVKIMGTILSTFGKNESLYSDYLTSFHIVHRCIERSFQRIEHILDDSERTGEHHAILNKGFRRYFILCIQFLGLHQKQEDKYIFPSFGEKDSVFRETIDNTLTSDHKSINILLEEANFFKRSVEISWNKCERGIWGKEQTPKKHCILHTVIPIHSLAFRRVLYYRNIFA